MAPSEAGVDAAPADANVPAPKPTQGEILVTDAFYRQLGKQKPAVERAEEIEIKGRTGKVEVLRLKNED